MKWHVWNNGGNSEGPGNWRYDPRYRDALVPQNKAMNDEHLAQLETEWFMTHEPPPQIIGNPPAMRAWRVAANRRAREWAVKMEPKRFLNPLLRATNGIPADTKERRTPGGATAILSSSWVGDFTTLGDTGCYIDLGGKKYFFRKSEVDAATGPGSFAKAMSAPSIGSFIAKNWIGKLPSSVVKRGKKAK